MMVGAAQGVRRFSGGGLCGSLSKMGMMRHWGDCLLNLPRAAASRRQRLGYVKYGKKWQLTPSMIAGHNLCLVSYTGAGKYDPGCKFFNWIDVPDLEDVSQCCGSKLIDTYRFVIFCALWSKIMQFFHVACTSTTLDKHL